MSKVSVHKIKNNRKKLEHVSLDQVDQGIWRSPDGGLIDSQHALISLLLPPAVKEFYRQLENQVAQLCGPRGKHQGDCHRWGTQDGSIYLGGQKVALERPRVRCKGVDGKKSAEVVPEMYERFQDQRPFDGQTFIEGIKHVSQRDYNKGLPKIAESFGFSKSSVSRGWIRASAKKLDELMNRDLSAMDIVAVFVDGKRFSSYGVVVALGVGVGGKKHVLGMYQADTENARSCLGLFNDLERRGLPTSELLFIVDGGSGLNSAIESKYATSCPEERLAVRVRCHYHKWKNLDDALKGVDEKVLIEAKILFRSIREAHDMVEAQAHTRSLEKVLNKANLSALNSFKEAKDDLLNLHALGLSPQLKKFFSTTNPVESLNSLTEEDLRRVKRWRDSSHFQRWYATSALEAEKRMKRVRGHAGLKGLKAKLKELCKGKKVDKQEKVA